MLRAHEDRLPERVHRALDHHRALRAHDLDLDLEGPGALGPVLVGAPADSSVQ